jgi:hypothetical protein
MSDERISLENHFSGNIKIRTSIRKKENFINLGYGGSSSLPKYVYISVCLCV